MKLRSVSRDFMLSFVSLFDPQLSVLAASLSERSNVCWMRCRATWTASTNHPPWTWKPLHHRSRPSARMRPNPKRPLVPYPERTRTSSQPHRTAWTKEPATSTLAADQAPFRTILLRTSTTLTLTLFWGTTRPLPPRASVKY